MESGVLIVISGPSGVGKGTIRARLLEREPSIRYSVSVTTRAPRPGEQDGREYYFISETEFLDMRGRGDLLEWAHVYDHYYGTPRENIEKSLAEGNDVLLEIDIQGARQVRANAPDAITVFILPEKIEDLVVRIHQRGTETAEARQKRIGKAVEEIRESLKYDYCVVNYQNQLDRAVDTVYDVIQAERARTPRFRAMIDRICGEGVNSNGN
jgi:guanylate kinase